MYQKTYINSKIKMKNKQIKCYCGHTTYCDCGTLEEPELINNCPKCGLDLIEREGSKPVCREIDCKGIVLSNETLREWALALKKEPKEDVLAETPFHLPDFKHLIKELNNQPMTFIPDDKTYTEQEVGELLYNVIGEYAASVGIIVDGAKLNDLFIEFKKK